MKASNIPPPLVAAHFLFSAVNYAQHGFYLAILCDFIVFSKNLPQVIYAIRRLKVPRLYHPAISNCWR